MAVEDVCELASHIVGPLHQETLKTTIEGANDVRPTNIDTEPLGIYTIVFSIA